MPFEPRSSKGFAVERRGNDKRTPLKPKVWSHQDELRSYKGRNVRLLIEKGDPIEGVLLEADQFTIKMHVAPEGMPPMSVVYFKSALGGFYVVPAMTTE